MKRGKATLTFTYTGDGVQYEKDSVFEGSDEAVASLAKSGYLYEVEDVKAAKPAPKSASK